MKRRRYCKSCGAELLWATTREGGPIALNRDHDPSGTLVHRLDLFEQEYIDTATERDIGPRYTSHEATCGRVAPEMES